MDDLSQHHGQIGSMFRIPSSPDQWRQYALTNEQLETYQRDGYVSGIRLLTDEQVDVLCDELTPLFDPAHPQQGLFHEFHSNESKDGKSVLFHALGAWRIAARIPRYPLEPGFHGAG